MKTPMQEMLEYVQDEVQLFGSARQILISKIKEMLDKEKEVIMQVLNDGKAMAVGNKENKSLEYYYNETFNTKEHE